MTDERSDAEEREFTRLKQKLTQARLLGQTWREQLMLQALDAEKAATPEPGTTSVDVRARSQKTVQMLRGVLQAAEWQGSSKTESS